MLYRQSAFAESSLGTDNYVRIRGMVLDQGKSQAFLTVTIKIGTARRLLAPRDNQKDMWKYVHTVVCPNGGTHLYDGIQYGDMLEVVGKVSSKKFRDGWKTTVIADEIEVKGKADSKLLELFECDR